MNGGELNQHVPPAPQPGAPPQPPRPAPTVVSVEVVRVEGPEVEVRLADGRTGVIPSKEFDSQPTPGQSVEAAVLTRDDPRGRVWLSRSWALKHQRWEEVVAAKASHTPVRGTVVKAVKGGYVVDVGLRAFLPSSLVDTSPAVDGGALVGTEIEALVTEADPVADRLVLSRRDHLRRVRRDSEKATYAALAVGGRARGTVVGVFDYGAQVDLGSVRGLIHRSELSWGRIDDPAEVVAIGEEVEVVVLEVHRGKRRVALSLRRVSDDPLLTVTVGEVDDAVITRVVEFGAFARLGASGAEGLIHVSELSELPGARPDQLVTPGEVVRVKVIDVQPAKRRLGLSVRQAVWS